jgi:hypothetical protein
MGAAVGSGIGTALAGGSALIADPGDGRQGVGVMLGGTGLGLVGGALAAPNLDLRAGAGYASLGALLGASEGMVFAWAGRADGERDYAGAGLVGAGVGSTLGLVAAGHPGWMAGRGLPAAGFAGWGAWMGAFGGALINRDPHEVTLGGLGGANVGLLAGLGLMSADLVEPRDFGWLSAFGAAGTVVGGGVGAAFSTRDDPRPALAGLLIGPAVGLGAGAILMPRVRTVGAPALASGRAAKGTPTAPRSRRASATRPRVRRGAERSDEPLSEPNPPTSADLLASRQPPGALQRFGHDVRGAFRLSHFMPVVGALPAPGGPAAQGGPPPFLLGVAGLWD